MKKTLICALFLYGVISCGKQENPIVDNKICCFNYELLEGTLNGQNWIRNGWVFGAGSAVDNSELKDSSAEYKCLDGLVSFNMGLVTQEGFTREILYIGRVSRVVKSYGVTAEYQDVCTLSKDTIAVGFYTEGSDGHVVKDFYKSIDKTYTNIFEVLSYEPIKNEFIFRFDLAFIRTRKVDITYPDTLYIKGKLRIEGFLKK